MELKGRLSGLIEIQVETGQLQTVVVLAGTSFQERLKIADGPGRIALKGCHMNGIAQGPDRRVGRGESGGEEALGVVIVSGINGQANILGVSRDKKECHEKKHPTAQKNPDKGYLHAFPFGTPSRRINLTHLSKKKKYFADTLNKTK